MASPASHGSQRISIRHYDADDEGLRGARSYVGGIPVNVDSLAQLIERMIAEAPQRRKANEQPALVFSCNGHALSLSGTSPAYRAALLRADIIHADGQSIVSASRWLPGPTVADRSATTDLFIDSVLKAHAAGLRYFLLGGTEEINAACAAQVNRQAPGLIVGRRHGYWTPEEEPDVVETINAAQADVVWVGLGKPREQQFCVAQQSNLNTGWLVTCGGLFNFVVGEYRRAPRWMRQAGLEWLHRLATNPRHLAWRYLSTNPHAMWLIWKHRHYGKHHG